jgi:predicted unusual protein kinase regulating ubiquinone biosynthesis (AarF/ABC1/UbiB family)
MTDPDPALTPRERAAIDAAKAEAVRAAGELLDGDDHAAPPPKTGLSRFFRLSSLSTKVSASYAASKVKRLFQSAPAAAAALDAVNLRNAARIAETLGELKGAVMKLGQVISIQEEAVPKEFRALLSKLQTQAPPMHPAFAIEIVEKELGAKLADRFADFERKPFAAASLGQVHRATLRTGERVVVKVQYPGIDESITSDLKLARPLVKTLALASKSFDLTEMLEEIEARLREEVDYLHEAENQDAMREGFARLGHAAPAKRGAGVAPDVVVPRVFRSHTTRRVLTMERLEGLHLDDFCAAVADPDVRRTAREKLSHAIWAMELELGMLHADPHPGNFLFLGARDAEGRFTFDGRIGLLDFGCVKVFPERFMRSYVRLIRAALARDDAAIVQAYVDLGFLREEERGAERAREWTLWTYQSIGPLLEDRVFPSRPGESWEKFIAEIHEGMQRVVWRVGAYTPRDAVYLNRVTLGVMCFWARLGGASNWHRILLEHLDAAEAGREAQAPQPGLAMARSDV